MNEYELVYILKPDMPVDRHERVQDRVKKILDEAKAAIVDQQDWGKRKLAYRVDKFLFGHYKYINFQGSGAFITELERMLGYEEGVMRYMTVKLADGSETSKAKMKKVNQPEEMRLRLDDARPYRDFGDRDRGDRDHHHHHHERHDEEK